MRKVGQSTASATTMRTSRTAGVRREFWPTEAESGLLPRDDSGFLSKVTFVPGPAIRDREVLYMGEPTGSIGYFTFLAGMILIYIALSQFQDDQLGSY